MTKMNLPKGTNWDKVAADELIPEGRFPARIDKVDPGESQAGNPKWGITFTFTEEPVTGRKLYESFSLMPRALWKLRQLAAACGIDLAGRDDLDTEELLSQEVGCVVTHDVFEGSPRTRVNTFFSVK